LNVIASFGPIGDAVDCDEDRAVGALSLVFARGRLVLF
jgi:hypothetical protein